MSFSFMVSGHAGEGMQGNSQEEIDAVRELIQSTLDAARDSNLNLTVHNVIPTAWAPDTLNVQGHQS